MAAEQKRGIVCLSLGGSIVSRRNGVNVYYIRKLSRLLNRYQNKYKFIITVGGGYASRLYIHSARAATASVDMPGRRPPMMSVLLVLEAILNSLRLVITLGYTSRFEKLDHNTLLAIASKYDTREAGSNFLFDLMASKIAKRAGIEIRFVNDNISELGLALDNKKYSGSIVRD